jgi:PAS domain S-box-containing protein
MWMWKLESSRMNLLIVDDNPTDTMVIQTRLRRAFPKAEIIVVDEPGQLKECLRRGNYDVVITDYWLGWSDGLSVLQQVRERWPRARVVMLTGNGGEEVVASAFKYGLYQYLLKPGFDDLVAVTRAAFESRQREAANELMASLVDSIPDGVLSVDGYGIITAMNASARRIYGYSDAGIIGRNFEILQPLKFREHARRLHEQAMGGEIVKGFPTVSVHSDGSEIAVIATLIPMRGIDRIVTCVACIATPIPAPLAIAQEHPRARKSVAFIDDLTAGIPSHR